MPRPNRKLSKAANSPPSSERGSTTALPLFLRETGNLKLAQMLAGHADIGTTANIYAHLDTTDLETALRALNER